MKPTFVATLARLHLDVFLLLLSAACANSSAWAQAAPPVSAQTAAQTATQAPAQDFSAAERLLFMSRQLANLRPPATLRYSLRKAGSLEEGFEDRVHVVLSAQPDGSCCAARGEFMTGVRQLPLPDVEGADGNPVVMYFLEHDVREMQRLTKGNQNHFRKRIRMAVYNAATVSEVRLNYRGRNIAGRMVSFSPYLDDPNRPRYEKLARKEYRFLLADAVPGGVFGIQTRVAAEAAAGAVAAKDTPLITEELWLEGAQALAFKALP
jgi:hypothetical protein